MAIKGNKRRVGFWGERRAVKYLKNVGYRILERNYRCSLGEVDIIAAKGEVVAFIEVKTRSDISFGQPNEAVTNERQNRYIRTAKYYFSGKTPDCVVRFDIIEVLRGKINHIERAFET